ncbi:MAG: EAL domain-containing protein [Selenomonadaceae bacterium]|nr:EAL domain-containing protein [Selenomonadaceae bacterium]
MKDELLTSFAAAYDLLPTAICFFRADGSEELIFANRAALALYQCEDRVTFHKHTGGHFRGLMLEDDYRPLESFTRQGSGREHYLTFQYRSHAQHVLRAEGYVQAIVHPDYGAFYCVTLSDASQRNDSLESDQVTRLMGMHAFFRRVAQEAKFRVADGTFCDYCPVYFNITNFRLYNTTHGIQRGDACLRHVAKVLRSAFPGMLLAHLAADNFAVFADAHDAQERIEYASQQVALFVNNPNIELKAGIRIFESDADASNTTRAFDEAKLACETIKRDATRIYAVYSPEMGRQLTMKSYVRAHFDEALDKGYIKVYYQPVIRTLTGKLCSFEALARWESPTHGRLSPADFIPALEEARLIHRLDAYVVEQVAKRHRQLAENDQLTLPVSFNLSRLDFALMDCPAVVEDIVRRYSLPRSLFHVEVTENALVDNSGIIQDGVRRFRELGYEVWLDDFGSGYSSLNVLKDYKFDELKLDMAFLRTFNEASSKIIRSSVCLAKELGMHTLAEGVETAEQVAFLRSIGCEKMQGWYFGKPLPYEECRQQMLEEGFVGETPAESFLYAAAGLIDITVPTPAAIWITTPEKIRVVQMNESYAKTLSYLGLHSEDEATRGLAALPAPIREKFRSLIQKAIATRQEETLTYVDNGFYMRIKLHTIAMVGKTCIHRAEFYNITADKSAREKDSEDLDKILRTIMLAYEGVYYIQPSRDRGDTYVSMTTSGKTGKTFYGLTTARHRFAEGYVHPADRKRYIEFSQTENIYAIARNSERSLAVSGFRILRSDGSYLWMKFTFLVLDRQAGKPYLLLVNRNAMAEQPGFQDFLQLVFESSGLDKRLALPSEGNHLLPIWRAFLQHTELNLFWKDKQRRFLGASRAFLDYYGFDSIDAILGKTDEEVGWHIDDNPFHDDENDVIHKGRIIKGAIGHCLIGGELHAIRASKAPIYENGKIVGLIGYFEDVDAAAQKDDLKRNLFLTDPATGLMGYRGMLMSGLQYVDNYRKNGEDFSTLVIDIPAFDQLHQVLGDDAQQKLLKRITDVLTSVMPPSAAISHIGSCTFFVFQKDLSDDTFHQCITQATDDIRAIHEIDGFPCTLYPHYATVHGSEAMSFDALLEILMERLKDAKEQNFGPSIYVGNRIAFDRESFDDFNECVVIVDPETDELAYCNKKVLELLRLPEDMPYQGAHCYELLYGHTTPCDNCPKERLVRGRFHTNLHHNEYAGCDLLMRGTLIPWRGKSYIFGFGLNLGDYAALQKEQNTVVQREAAASDAIRVSMRDPDPKSGLQKLLTSYGRRFGCDRVLFFEEKRDDIRLAYRWESPAIAPLAENFAPIPRKEVAHFYERFAHKNTFIVRDFHDYWRKHPQDAPHIPNLNSAILARVSLDGEAYGLLEAVNVPAEKMDDAAQVLATLSRFAAILLRNRNLMKRLDRAGKVDQMTGVYNRRGLLEAVERLIPGVRYALVFLDVNGLKHTNDTLGHKAGDKLIRGTAAILRSVPSAATFRMGGDEFLLVKRIKDEDEVPGLLEKLRHHFRDADISTAIGATVVRAPIDDIDAALAKADEQMYIDKKKHYESRHDRA